MFLTIEIHNYLIEGRQKMEPDFYSRGYRDRTRVVDAHWKIVNHKQM